MSRSVAKARLLEISMGQLRKMIESDHPTAAAIIEVVSALGRRNKLPLALYAIELLVRLVNEQRGKLDAFATGELEPRDEQRVSALLGMVNQGLSPDFTHTQGMLDDVKADPAVRLAVWTEVARLAMARLNVTQGELMDTTLIAYGDEALLAFLREGLASQKVVFSREQTATGMSATLTVNRVVFTWQRNLSAGVAIIEVTAAVPTGSIPVLPQAVSVDQSTGRFDIAGLNTVHNIVFWATPEGHATICGSFLGLHEEVYGSDCAACKKLSHTRVPGMDVITGTVRRRRSPDASEETPE